MVHIYVLASGFINTPDNPLHLLPYGHSGARQFKSSSVIHIPPVFDNPYINRYSHIHHPPLLFLSLTRHSKTLTLSQYGNNIYSITSIGLFPFNKLHTITESLVSSSLLATSDGSATTSNATFGWTLRTQTTEIAYCYGPVHGSNPTAFRAKATGLLLLLCFLSNLFLSHHWISLPFTMVLSVHIDNLSLINRVHRLLHYPCISPSSTVSPEYDLLTQISTTISQLPLALSFHHIHSHQDARAAIHTLSIPAQANFLRKLDVLLSALQCSFQLPSAA